MIKNLCIFIFYQKINTLENKFERWGPIQSIFHGVFKPQDYVAENCLAYEYQKVFFVETLCQLKTYL